MSRAVLLTVAYDGTPFGGWALQNNSRTIAGELTGAVRAVDPRASALRGTSRTDSGVHARGQIVAFDTNADDINPRGWVLALTQHLPSEIAVVGAARAEHGFDPRGHVLSKTYRYSVLESPVRDPFLEGRVWRRYQRLNQMRMAEAASHLVGEHDFAAFRGAADTREITVRRLFRVDVQRARTDERILEIIVQGDRFLYHMVRIIAGTLVDVGRGRLSANVTRDALSSKSRGDSRYDRATRWVVSR
ncbi:MAG: tRNA pseudouridine(38-40) synthase TruA [Polyangiaceae bacterium]